MTKQIDDIIIYNETRYIIRGYVGKGLFHPKSQGITLPLYSCTACYRNYYNVYEIYENRLYLIEVYIYFGEEDEERIRQGIGPKLFGKLPDPIYYEGFEPRTWPFKDKKVQVFSGFHKIDKIKEPLSFNGSLLIAYEKTARCKDGEFGYTEYEYINIKEILFSNGCISKILDRSGEKGDIEPKLYSPNV